MRFVKAKEVEMEKEMEVLAPLIALLRLKVIYLVRHETNGFLEIPFELILKRNEKRYRRVGGGNDG